jgi:hypothetical protein
LPDAQAKLLRVLEWKRLIDNAGLRYERIISVAEDLVSIVEARIAA